MNLRTPAFLLAAIATTIVVADHFSLSKPFSPEYILWAWQRTEDLSFLKPESTIALWTGTITLQESGLSVESRNNPVTYPADAHLLPVIRIETTEVPDTDDVHELVLIITELTRHFEFNELQIDFDARVSQRDFYNILLTELGHALPKKKLGITALASWCFGDPWIQTLPIDSAVAMIYRMGPDADVIRTLLSEGGHYSASICDYAIGYSNDEPIPPTQQTLNRVFIYSPTAWTEQAYLSFTEETSRTMQEHGNE